MLAQRNYANRTISEKQHTHTHKRTREIKQKKETPHKHGNKQKYTQIETQKRNKIFRKKRKKKTAGTQSKQTNKNVASLFVAKEATDFIYSVASFFKEANEFMN